MISWKKWKIFRWFVGTAVFVFYLLFSVLPFMSYTDVDLPSWWVFRNAVTPPTGRVGIFVAFIVAIAISALISIISGIKHFFLARNPKREYSKQVWKSALGWGFFWLFFSLVVYWAEVFIVLASV